MTLSRKATAVHTVLLALTVWPLVHLALVARYDISPWKLAGWGMYTTPRFGLLGMEVYGQTADGAPWEQLTGPSPEVQAAGSAFLERHRWLRRLAGADALLAAVRASHPQWQHVRLVVAYPEIDRTSGMVVMVQDERRFDLR